MSTEITLTSANFDTEAMQSTTPVLIDFWAEWCMPCKMVAPLIDQIASQYAGKLKVGKVNVDEESELSNRFGIISIPTLLVIKDGQVVRQRVGALPKHELENLFKDLL